MIKIVKSYNVKVSVIAIGSDKENIYFTDCDGNIHTIEKNNYNQRSLPLIPKTQIPLHKFQKGSCFSKNAQVAYSIWDNKSCALSLKIPISVQEEEYDENEVHKEAVLFQGNDQKAEVVSFCGLDGEYIFTGGNDGRVYMYSTQNGKVSMSLKPKPEYISSIAVDDKGSFIAYGAFDKSLSILNLKRQKEYLNTSLSDVIEHSFFYGNSKFFYAIGRDGNSYIYDIRKGEFSKKALFSAWPNCCVADKSQRFAIVGARNGMIYIVKLSDNSIFSSFKLDQKGIASLYVEDNNLFIGFENGWMYIVDMHAFVDDFSQALSIKDFKSAKRCLDNNLLLSIHPMSEMFQEAWEEILREIINQFSSGNAALAFEFAEPFLSDEKHKREFESLLQKQKEFEEFSNTVEKKEFFNAYGMLSRSPYLSKTDSARKLELYFSKYFTQAKKLIAENPLKNIAKAKELLKPFSNVEEKKEMIDSLLKNHDIHLKADTYIKEKKFKEYFILTSKYDFLTKEDIYKKVCSLGESSIFKIKRLIDEKRYNEAFNGVKQIIVFLPFKDELMRIAKDIQLRQKLVEFIQTDNAKAVYELINTYPELENMSEFEEYDKKFDDTLSKAMLMVSQGDIRSVQSVFLPYVKVSIFQDKIKECVRQAAFNKLSSLLMQNSIDNALPIASYYKKEFGKDKEYKRLLEEHGLDHNDF
mgnify:CR=1 FL=1